MTDRKKVMGDLEGLTFDDWRMFHSDSEVQITAKNALQLLKEQKEEQSGWISVKERMPVELHSIFYPWYGKKEWSNAMWREQSDKVLVTVEFKDGTRLVTTGETHDGVWNTAISRTLDPIVTHWMQFPELPEGVKWE